MTTTDLPEEDHTAVEVAAVTVAEEPALAAIVLPTTITEEQADQLAGAVGRNWGVLLGLGVVLAGLGVAVLVWPQATIGVVAVLLGIALLVTGVFSVIGALTRGDHPTGLRVASGLSGVLSVVLGVLALSGITEAVTVLALMIGFGWIVRGISELALGLAAKGKPGRGLLIAAGVLSLFAGVAVLVWPSITLHALAYLSGFSFILFGLLQVALAFRLRKVQTAEDLRMVVGG